MQNKIINGLCDWVYEEEFAFDKAFEWNTDGTMIAYYRFDETQVKEFGFTHFGTLYPTNNTFKYPKAGENNSEVNLVVYSLASKKNTLVETGKETNQYIPRIKWTNNPNQLSFLRLNRLQNYLELILADANTGKPTIILSEKAATYVDINDDLTFLADNKSFIWSSEKDGYNQLYHYALDGKLINKITPAKSDVISFEGIDEKKGIVYYTAAVNTINKEVFSIKLTGEGLTNLSPNKGYNTPSFTISNYFSRD